MKCSNCGHEISQEDKFCMNCGQKVQKEIKYENNVRPESGENHRPIYEKQNREENRVNYQNMQYQRGNAVLRNSLPQLAEGEKVIKDYRCSELKFPYPKCEGRITVTNRRVIYHGEGGTTFPSNIVQSVDLQDIKGVSTYYGTNFNWKLIFIGVILIILGLMSTGFASSTSYYAQSMVSSSTSMLILLLWFVGGLLLFFGIQRIFFLNIFSTATNPIVSVGGLPMSIFGNNAVFSISAKPSVDTDLMMHEISALIMDLQTLGDYAVEKWC